MKATIRNFHSPDADLDTFTPDDPHHVGVLVQMMVGPVNGQGVESFDVVVCTPSWLAEWIHTAGPTIGRHHLIVTRFDREQVKSFLTAAVEAEQADTWAELAGRIGRIGKWEFEDYQD